jgi:MFS transporter, PPP family, 3-phenylpropionic acid transporter
MDREGAASRRTGQAIGDPRPALAAVYAGHFAHLGIVLPFLPPWLLERGFGPLAIGALLALGPAAKVAAAWTWGRWADRSGRRRGLLVLAGILAAAAFAALPLPEAFLLVFLLMAVYAFAVAPVLPFAEATALEQADVHGFSYGPVRLWGSVSFMVASWGYGALRGTFSGEAGIVLAAGFLALTSLLALALPRPLREASLTARSGVPAAGRSPGSPRPLLSRPGLVRFLASCALMQVSHGAYYAFYSIRLQNLGYGSTAIGLLWALGVAFEVSLLVVVDRVVRRFGARAVLRASLLAAAVRWLMISMAAAPGWLAAAQSLHAMTYASFHVAGLRELARWFGPGERATGQALYSGLTYGSGIFVGTLLAGAIADAAGLPAVFAASSGMALLGLVLMGKQEG